MSMLDRYLRAVEFWLPRDTREDVIEELGDDLRSQIDDQAAELGRPLNEAEMGALLARRGNPAAMASKYLPPRYLVGPELYPVYRFVLKMVAFGYLLPATLVGIVLIALNAAGRPLVPGLTPWGLVEYLWMWGIHAFVVVTVAFALMQRSAVRERLAKAAQPRDPFHASRFDALADVAFGAVMVVASTGLLSGLAVGEMGFAMEPAFRGVAWAVAALYGLNAVLAAVRAVQARWTLATARVQLATTGALLLIFAGLLAANLFGADAVSITIPGATIDQLWRLTRWANATAWITMVVGLTIVAWNDTVRLRRLRDAAPAGPSARNRAAAPVMVALMAAGFLTLIASTRAVGQADGAAVYRAKCAGCHNAGGRVPSLPTLRAMSPSAVRRALDTGPMAAVAAGLDSAERAAVVAYVAAQPAAIAPRGAGGACGAGTPAFSGSARGAGWGAWGVDAANTRFQPAVAAGLSPADVPRLRLRWAFGLGDVTEARGQVAVAGGRVFVGTTVGEVHALDARTGCRHWTYAAEAAVRGAVVVGGRTAWFGDQKANVYAVDAAGGGLLWKRRVDDHPTAMVTGAPQLHAGVLYVPVSSYESAIAGAPGYVCCTFRGSVVALDAATGRQLWKTYTVDSARVAGKNPAGADMRGPSGAPVWSTPTIDVARGALYVGTGNNYSDPPSGGSDAVIAMELRTGRVLWTRQLTANDAYTSGCDFPGKPGCPAANGPDFDLGQPPILVRLASGRRALVVGQKSGMAHALDPDREGAVLWQRRVSEGGKLGGPHWGSAVDGERMYVAVSDARIEAYADSTSPMGFALDLGRRVGGGLHALRLASGEPAWIAPPVLICGERRHCGPAQSAAVTAIPGVVFSGSMDGHLRAYAAATGAVVWDEDTARDFVTVNGVPARGGSMDVAGPVVAGGMLFVSSGYGLWGGMPGNVLLAYSVDGR